MKVTTETQYKRHKIYRWIALFSKIISKPLLDLAFLNVIGTITLKTYGTQPLSSFLATLFSLIIYYGLIFILNRLHNFHSKTPLFKSILLYSLLVVFLLTIEALYQNPIVNSLYKLTNLGIYNPVIGITLSNVKNKIVYLSFSILIQLLFSFVTGVILFIFYKKVLNNKNLMDKI